MTHGWLTHESRVVTSVSIAQTRAERRRGLRGLQNIDFPLVITPCRWVNSLGMKISIDVMYLNKQSEVVRIQRLAPRRIARPMLRATQVVEAKVGAFDRWNLMVGDTVEIRFDNVSSDGDSSK